MSSKPPYRVPLMEEINQLPHNGFNMVSTFSGCGGSCLGFKMAGFKVLWANEFIPAAQATYKANHKGTFLNTQDIRKVSANDILDQTNLRKGELDVLEGSPPCAAFSTCGKREKCWGQVKDYSETRQRVDDLFWEYIRLIREIQPKVFVAENVSGLIKGTAKGYFKQILSDMGNCGYNVKASLLDSRWLGVPQMRQRIIFMGIRNDLGLAPVYPTPLPYQYNVRDAFEGLPPQTDIKLLGPGTKMKRLWENSLPTGYFSNAHKKLFGTGSSFNHRRLLWYKPAGTVIQGSFDLYHPDIPRYLTIQEIKRICAFPDDFILTGSFAQQWERCGRAVPPVMMYHVAKTIRDEILCKI